MSKPEKFKRCFINDAFCNKTIISAHTLSKAATMSLLKSKTKAGEQVIYLGAKSNERYKPALIGWSNASAYNCFCSVHDALLFNPIENSNIFDPKNKEHLFLHTYRSFAYCYYKRKKEIDPQDNFTDGFTGMTEELSKLMFPNESLAPLNKEHAKKISLHIHFSSYERIKVSLNTILRSKQYDEMEFRVCVIPKRYPFASAGTLMAKIVDTKNKKMSSYSRDERSPIIHNQGLITTVLPDDQNRTTIIVGFLKDDINALRLVQKIDKLDSESFAQAISGLILTSNKENTYMHPKLWDYIVNKGYEEQIISELNEERDADLLDFPIHQSKLNLFSKEFTCEKLEIK